MARYRVQFSATIPQDSDDESVKILGGDIIATIEIEADNVAILTEHFNRIRKEMDGLEKYRFEVYALNGNDQARLVGLQTSDS